MICTDFDMHVASKFTSRGICSEVFAKERLLKNSDLEGVALCWLPLCRFAISSASALWHHDQSAKADQSTLAKADQSKSLAVTSNLLHCSGLQSESLGLLDLLVLLKARRFVGFVSSTFSWMV